MDLTIATRTVLLAKYVLLEFAPVIEVNVALDKCALPEFVVCIEIIYP